MFRPHLLPACAALLVLTSVLLPPTPASAGAKIVLEYERPQAATDLSGSLDITVENNRPAAEGGDELALIGQIRSMTGIPYGLFAGKKGSAQVDVVVGRWLADTLRAEGWRAKPAKETPTGARLHVVIDEFWADWEAGPYTYYTVMTLRLQLFPPGADTPVLEQKVTAKDTVTLVFGVKEFAEAHRRMFTSAGADVATMAAKPEFGAALAP